VTSSCTGLGIVGINPHDGGPGDDDWQRTQVFDRKVKTNASSAALT
jgi:hypothetical protein